MCPEHAHLNILPSRTQQGTALQAAPAQLQSPQGGTEFHVAQSSVWNFCSDD